MGKGKSRGSFGGDNLQGCIPPPCRHIVSLVIHPLTRIIPTRRKYPHPTKPRSQHLTLCGPRNDKNKQAVSSLTQDHHHNQNRETGPLHPHPPPSSRAHSRLH